MKQDQAHKKWVVTAFLLMAVCIAFLSGKLIEHGIYVLNLQRRIRNVFVYGQLLSVVFGIASFTALLNYERFRNYMHEVVAETVKVSWPVKKEVVATTIVVMIGILIASVFLGVFDHFFSLFMRWLVTR